MIAIRLDRSLALPSNTARQGPTFGRRSPSQANRRFGAGGVGVFRYAPCMDRTAIQGNSYSLQVFIASVLLLYRSTDNAAETKTAFQLHGEKHLVKRFLAGAGTQRFLVVLMAGQLVAPGCNPAVDRVSAKDRLWPPA